MKVLALDTTTVRGSVALLVDGQVAGEVRTTTADGHSRWLLPAVEQLLHQQGRRVFDLDGFAVTTGPGSFTGQRVGLATVQGLALGANQPCVGLSALDVLASLAGPEGPAVALMDAWRNEVYACVYEGGRPLGPASAGPLAGLVPLVPKHAVFLGDGAVKFRDEIGRLWPEARVLETELFLAVPTGRLAAQAFGRGEGRGPESLLPLYLRGAVDRQPRS
jgi:tRNA threonylcarbamoyladenosine biosynthesis protein TsaB